MENTQEQTNLKSLQLYKGKAPLPLQIVGGLMWLGGLSLIIQGIPLLLLLGVGIIPICLGGFTIHYARAIFKMQKKGYNGAMALLILTLAAYLAAFFTSKVTSAGIALLGGAICYVFIVFVILRRYRSQFI